MKKRNHYIRYPTKWEDVEKFITMLDKNNIDWHILQTVSAMNFFYLDEMYLWTKNLGKNIAYNYVVDPSFLSPNVIPLSVKRKIFQKLSYILDTSKIQEMKNLFENANNGGWNQFIKYTKELDLLRNQKFEDFFPAFVNLLKNEGYKW